MEAEIGDLSCKPEPGNGASSNRSVAVSQRKPVNKGKLKSTVIDHRYYDYSTQNFSELLAAQEKNSAEGEDDDTDEQRNKSTSIKKSKRVTFPMKLHEILSNPAYRHIIAWLPHGRCWNIYDKDLLESAVCKNHFNHENFDSFNRSVNMWGFKRLISSGPDFKAYYHEKFLRGLPDHAKLIRRLVKPGKRLPDPDGEPNFYEIAKQFPLPPDPHVAEDEAVEVEVQSLSSRRSEEGKNSHPMQKLVPQFSRQPKSKPVCQVAQNPNPKPGISYGNALQQQFSAVKSPYPVQAPPSTYDQRPGQLLVQPVLGSICHDKYHNAKPTRNDTSHPSSVTISHPRTVLQFDPYRLPYNGCHQQHQSNPFVPPIQQIPYPYYAHYPPQCHHYPPRQDFPNAANGNAAPQLEAYYCSNRPDDISTQNVHYLATSNLYQPTSNPYEAVASVLSSYGESEEYVQMLGATFNEEVHENKDAYFNSYEGNEQEPSATTTEGAALSEPFGANEASMHRDRSLSVDMWSVFLAENQAAANVSKNLGSFDINEEIHEAHGSGEGLGSHDVRRSRR